MRGDKAVRDVRRLDRWMSVSMQAGDDVTLSFDAATLMFDRLDARRCAARWCLPALIVGLVVAWAADFGPYGSTCTNCTAYYDGHATQEVLRLSLRHDLIDAVGVILVLGSLVVWGFLVQRLEQRVARTLLRRTSSTSRHTILSVLRPAGVGFAVLLIGYDATGTVDLFRVGDGSGAWVLLTSFLVCLALAGLALARIASRAAIAIDPTTLSLDERLRSAEAMFALTSLMGIGYLYSDLSSASNATDALSNFHMAGGLAVVLYAICRIQRRWRPPASPTPAALAPMNSVDA
jgi:hypothetical protein